MFKSLKPFFKCSSSNIYHGLISCLDSLDPKHFHYFLTNYTNINFYNMIDLRAYSNFVLSGLNENKVSLTFLKNNGKFTILGIFMNPLM